MLLTGFQCSAEGKLALSAVPSPANGLCSAALLWPPEQARALGTKMLLPRREEWSLCVPREREEMPDSLQRVGLPSSLPMCIFCALRAEGSTAECAFVSTGQFWRGKHRQSQARQAQIFLCPMSLTCELLYPTTTFSASQTDRTGLAAVQHWRYEAQASKAFLLVLANKINSVFLNNSCSALCV